MSERLYELLCEHLPERKREVFSYVAARRTRHVTLVLEDIYQTQNASAIFRSAESWGIQDIHVIENDHSFNFHRRISKGAYDWLTLHRYNESVNNTLSCVTALREKGYTIISTTLDEHSVTPENLDLSCPVAIVMGTELTGVSNQMKQLSDGTLHIPTCGFTESLNVSVAAGIIARQLISRLYESDLPWQLSPAEQLELKIEWARKTIQWSDHLISLYESGEI